tara:strand:- start:386 stop:661 length:276 start_codon:yes stop_codon:yes gene_type:complete
MNLDAPASAVHEMERQMRISEDVLRYITIRVDEFEEGPSVMMRSRDRDDRSRRSRDDRESRRDDPESEVAEEDERTEASAETVEKSEGDNE